MSDFQLDRQHVVVTGAAQGIGWEIARTLAEAGATVALLDIDGAKAEAAAQELREKNGRGHLAFELDVRDSVAVGTIVERVFEAFDKVDVLVNNAGIVKNTPVLDISDEEWTGILDVNLNGVFYCSREFGRKMVAAGRGSIVNIASMSGLVVNKPQPQSHYNTSKAAVIMLTKSLAVEWAEFNVRVNSVSPGYIGTELTKLGLSNEAWRRTWFEMTPFGRVGDPHDVATAVQYLASDAARYVTGSNVVVDGGYTAW